MCEKLNIVSFTNIYRKNFGTLRIPLRLLKYSTQIFSLSIDIIVIQRNLFLTIYLFQTLNVDGMEFLIHSKQVNNFHLILSAVNSIFRPSMMIRQVDNDTPLKNIEFYNTYKIQ